MTERQILCYRHHVEGEIVFSLSGDLVQLSCHWPFDRETNEWIDFDLRFLRSDFESAARQLASGNSVRISGLEHGTLELVRISDSRVQMHASAPGAAFRIPLRIQPRDLLPSSAR